MCLSWGISIRQWFSAFLTLWPPPMVLPPSHNILLHHCFITAMLLLLWLIIYLICSMSETSRGLNLQVESCWPRPFDFDWITLKKYFEGNNQKNQVSWYEYDISNEVYLVIIFKYVSLTRTHKLSISPLEISVLGTKSSKPKSEIWT